ncbi:OLC1v1029396C1 [Oldenlandia corymbosa var. corymbosa]|uniref:OLC1v1029396C1 n=1 Tax=Oldenlandia corymbosa var. corymbosa TaxID=529605 RepID=A0AAV1CEN3_OLDCO|nr:OLC1v1029396C1 [Oldenlandia corymbosa var. corymbosa]
MLEKSIMLQVLKISMKGECEEHTHHLSWRDPTGVLRCLSPTLTKFSFKGLVGREDEVKMLRYVLNQGRILKGVELVFRPPSTDLEPKFHVLQKISLFPRGSDDCEVSFT